MLQRIEIQRPVMSEQDEVADGQVVTEDIQRWGEHEQGEEADLGQ